MNRTPWRRTQEPLDRAELSRLLPAPGDPDLPHDRRRLLEEHLMNEIQPKARPVRRALYIGVPLTAMALAGVLLTGVLGAGSGPGAGEVRGGGAVDHGAVDLGSTQNVASTLSRISAAAERQPVQEPDEDQYVYVKSTVSFLRTEVGPKGSKSWVSPPHTREDWKSPDGQKGWYVEEGVTEGASLDYDENEGGGGSEELNAPYRPSLNAPSYDYLKALPTDPDVLLKKIYEETKGAGNGPHQQAFVTIGDLLRGQLASPKVSAALYRTAAKIPGVVLVESAEDAAGREGVAVALTDREGVSRTEWIFDRKTYAHLGERTVQLKDAYGVKAGTVTASTAALERSVVDGKGDRPGAAKH
ncbi:CU044_5270 family protein [Streptomyces sp. NPDC020141]|uniref:CU044_5270 family protein n=1 Tax=Streptomyces sp. NPDC020141 TaxID=3365065 RepID=UPI0037A67852